jgi:tetratricopeptide (TPR) repeat protein
MRRFSSSAPALSCRILASFALALATSVPFAHPQRAWAQEPAPDVLAEGLGQNAARAEIEGVLGRLARAASAGDAQALALLDVPANEREHFSSVRVSVRQIGVSPQSGRALARVGVEVLARVGGEAVLLSSRTLDLALSQGGGGWTVAGQKWVVPDPTFEALPVLAQTAREEWAELDAGPAVAPGASSAARDEVVLHLVVERRAGRWIALRRFRWTGRVLSRAALARREVEQKSADEWMGSVLAGRAGRADEAGGGTLHVLMQNGARGWVGLEGVWEPHLAQAQARDFSALRVGPPAPASRDAVALTREILVRRASLSARASELGEGESHLALGRALESVGAFGEAADSYERAQWLRPNRIAASTLVAAQSRRALDPAARAVRQLQEETQLGMDASHPTYVLDALIREQKKAPSPLRALRMGLEYSKWGDDEQASRMLDYAKNLTRQGAWRRMAPEDAAWMDVLIEHLEQRRQLAPIKPPNILRSALFSVRCRLDESSVLPVLAALESAQHTVYADFRVPMGATEVVLWRTQKEFQDYTTRFSAQGGSEFVAALTLTKLIATQAGPWVLGEEVNVFVDERLRESTFGTVAHEYGHVAVRQLSKGRNVPVWFNEGVATVVEGGYDGYIERVRRAKSTNRLLSMAAMREWNVDGEKAFLAYSQANSMVDYIVVTWGPDSLLQILRQIGDDVPAERAFQNILKVSTTELWNRWAAEGIR